MVKNDQKSSNFGVFFMRQNFFFLVAFCVTIGCCYFVLVCGPKSKIPALGTEVGFWHFFCLGGGVGSELVFGQKMTKIDKI